MTDIDRVRDLIISLSRSWHPSREQVQRIVDAVRGVEVEMQTPDASTVTEEAVEVALVAWCGQYGMLVPDEEMDDYRRTMKGALEDALPHLTALLSDPNAVHVSMLAGKIAKPSMAQIEHIYQDEFRAVTAAKDAEIERLRKALTDIITRSETGTLGASKVVDMRHIACAALGDAT